MSDSREAFKQIYSIPTGAEWCEKRHIYIHKNYSGLVLHPINESWEAFCEGVMWQAARAKTDACCSEIPNSCEPVYFYQEPEAVGSNKWREVPGRTLERQRQQSHFRGFKHRTLYTHPVSAAKQAVSVPSILYDGYAVFQEVQHARNSKGLENIKDSALVSDVLDAVVKLIKQEQDQ